MRRKSRISPSKLPIVLNVSDIMNVLHVGETTAKNLFSREDFPKLEFMKRNLILKDSFFKWLERTDEIDGR